MKHGETIFLDNGQGMTMEVMPRGATITDLQVPDRQGHSASVVLGYQSIGDYAVGKGFLGATVGRIPGRLTRGRFTLDGREFQLECNNGPNHLHGGSNALDKREWQVLSRSPDGVTMAYRSPDGEEGYPGTVDLELRYRLVAGNEGGMEVHDLVIEMTATTDAPTPLSTTNHAYFNLSGGSDPTVDDHLLSIDLDRYVPVVDEAMTLSDNVVPVAGTEADLRQLQPLGEAISRVYRQHGDNYVIRVTGEENTGLRRIARAVHPPSGRVMDVLTDCTNVQFFGGHYLLPEPLGRTGRPIPPRAGFCLECQGYPNGPNHPEIDDIILRPGEVYSRTTIYRFSVQP